MKATRHWASPDGAVQVLPGVKLHHPQHAVALPEHVGVGWFDHLAEVVLHERSGQAFSTGNKLDAARAALQHKPTPGQSVQEHKYLSKGARHACTGALSGVAATFNAAVGLTGILKGKGRLVL